MTTFTQMLAWCTWYAELAHSAHSLMSSHTSLTQDLSLVINISIVIHERTSLSRFSSSISTCPFLSSYFPSTSCSASCTLSSTTRSSWKACATPPRGDVSVSLTGCEPNFMTFGELNDSSGSFSYIIPSSDQHMDDVTLGKLLTEAHRGQADYCEPEGVSVRQSSSSVVFDGSGKPDGERNVDQSVGFGATRNTYSAHSKFSENTQTEKMVDGSGKLDERNSSNAQIRTLLEESRQKIIAEYCEKIGHHELQAAHAEEEHRLLREELWRQKLEFSWSSSTKSYREGGITKIPKFYLRYARQTEAHRGSEHYFGIIRQSTSNYKDEVICMTDSKDFQDAESVRSGNSHVTSRPVSFPPHSDTGRDVEAFFRVTAPQRRAAKHLEYTWYIGKRFCKSTCFLFSSLSSRNESMGDNHWGTASHVYSGEESKTRIKSRSEIASLDRQPKIQSSSVEETLQRIMRQTNNDCRFRISILTSSLHQQPLLAGR